MKDHVLSLTLLLAFLSCATSTELDSKIEIGDILPGPDVQLLECFYINLIARNVLPDNYTVTGPIGIYIDIPYTASLNFTFSAITILGLNNTEFYECDTMNWEEDVVIKGREDFKIDFHDYTLEGSLVDRIPLTGSGQAEVIVENFQLQSSGYGEYKITGEPFKYTEFSIDLILEKWWVFINEINPGTDMAAIFNSFFMQVGPELFMILTEAINDIPFLTQAVNALIAKWNELPQIETTVPLSSSTMEATTGSSTILPELLEESIQTFDKIIEYVVKEFSEHNPFERIGIKFYKY